MRIACFFFTRPFERRAFFIPKTQERAEFWHIRKENG